MNHIICAIQETIQDQLLLVLIIHEMYLIFWQVQLILYISKSRKTVLKCKYLTPTLTHENPLTRCEHGFLGNSHHNNK